MLEEEAYVTLWNLLETIPTLADPPMSVQDEIWQFNQKWPPSPGPLDRRKPPDHRRH